jgi:hypothetical protein
MNGRLRSPEHGQDFEVKDTKLQLFKEKGNTYKLRLNINCQNTLDWFKQKYQEVKQATNYYKRPSIKPEEGKNKGIKMQ